MSSIRNGANTQPRIAKRRAPCVAVSIDWLYTGAISSNAGEGCAASRPRVILPLSCDWPLSIASRIACLRTASEYRSKPIALRLRSVCGSR